MNKNYYVLILTLITFLGLGAQAQTSFAFQHCALGVKDVDESTKFYQEILGFQEIVNRSEAPGIRWLSLGNGQELHLIQVESLDVSEIKQTHLAWSTPNFEAVLDVLEKHNLEMSDWAGTKKGPNLRVDGVVQVYFQDPNGYWIEINDEYKK